MLKKIAAAALVAGSLGFVAAPAMAETVCLDVYVDVNGQVVEQNVCA